MPAPMEVGESGYNPHEVIMILCAGMETFVGEKNMKALRDLLKKAFWQSAAQANQMIRQAIERGVPPDEGQLQAIVQAVRQSLFGEADALIMRSTAGGVRLRVFRAVFAACNSGVLHIIEGIDLPAMLSDQVNAHIDGVRRILSENLHSLFPDLVASAENLRGHGRQWKKLRQGDDDVELHLLDGDPVEPTEGEVESEIVTGEHMDGNDEDAIGGPLDLDFSDEDMAAGDADPEEKEDVGGATDPLTFIGPFDAPRSKAVKRALKKKPPTHHGPSQLSDEQARQQLVFDLEEPSQVPDINLEPIDPDADWSKIGAEPWSITHIRDKTRKRRKEQQGEDSED